MSSPEPIARPRRLHVGAGDPLGYPQSAREFFGDGSWVHLHAAGDSVGRNASLLRRIASRARRRVSPKARARRAEQERLQADALTWLHMPFWIDEMHALPFRDSRFTFALSEHVVEHLFQHEAFRLMQEVRRVLLPGGVFRISVPDADLRPNGLEPLAFHAGRKATSHDADRWNDPAVHKTRWNLYGMTLLLELAGFIAVPLRAWDRYGTCIGGFPESRCAPYPDDADWDALLRSDYLRRPDSLIIDAIARS